MEQLTTRCKLKQGSKKVFNANSLIEFKKVSCIHIHEEKEIRLLNSRRKKPLSIFVFVFYIILIMQYVV